MNLLNLQVQIGTEKLNFSIEANNIRHLLSLTHIDGQQRTWIGHLDSEDDVIAICIIRDIIIIHKKDRDWRDGAAAVSWVKDDRRINNVDAYDWNGTHLWNIGDIIGDIRMSVNGISLTTYDRALHEDGLRKTDDISQDLFYCTACGFRYLIDPAQKKIVDIKNGKW